MKKSLIVSAVLLVLAACAVVQSIDPPGPSYCADGSSTAPCPVIPVGPIAVTPGYSTANLEAVVQNNFDNASWQTFVALNWPANSDGTANTSLPLVPPAATPRVWDYYKDVNEVFLPNGAPPNSAYPSTSFPPPPSPCKSSGGASQTRLIRSLAKIDASANIPDSFEEAAVNLPLIDSSGNFVVYSISMNKTAFEYIYGNKLYDASQQKGVTIDFPDSSAGEGAILVKSAWKVLTAVDVQSHYITRQMEIYVPASHSATGQAFCTDALTMGLIGMHIVHKIQDNVKWVWSTFEHVNNAPQSPTSVPATTTGSTTTPCTVPVAKLMSLYNPACLDGAARCQANQPPVPVDSRFVWQTTQPYAKAHLTNKLFGTQVVRCASIYNGDNNNGTASLNTAWQQQLPLPYSSYMLIGTQWFAGTDGPAGALTRRPATAPGPTVANGNQTAGGTTPPAPPLLQNTAAETYLQNGTTLGLGVGSCIGCHGAATDAVNAPSDFTFMLGRAQSPAGDDAARRQRAAEIRRLLAATSK